MHSSVEVWFPEIGAKHIQVNASATNVRRL
jgi:hypothetical protein